MPELKSCYFCAAPDDVQEYALVPPRFVADESDQRSAVLCETCKGKLLRVIEPLANRLEGDAGSAVSSTDGTSTPPSESPTAAATSVAGDDSGATDRASGDGTVAGSVAAESSAAESPAGEAVNEAAGEGAGAASATPPNYRKAMRLLSNREFPMERHAVEELLGGAYAMENEEIAAVLAYAEESGRLHEDDGTLKRA